MNTFAIACLMASTSAIQLSKDVKTKYEPGWGMNSGNSYNNGPTTHFNYGRASPYSVTKDDLAQVDNKYEPNWGWNSGSSYNNGPFTNFNSGRASPYAVTNDDLQVAEADVKAPALAQYEPNWGWNSGSSYNNGPFTNFNSGRASPYAVTNDDLQVAEADIRAPALAQKKYEPNWGWNSGSSYNNGPFTNFNSGRASPYAVTNDDLQVEQEVKYEPNWGWNSGSSYNNGPFTNFNSGRASPYAVTNDDLQVAEANVKAPALAQKKYEPNWGWNSGSSYNNGPFTNFNSGRASPYAVTNDD